MTEKAARRIWLICSGILFVLTFNYFSISQSWGASLGLGFLSIDIGVSNDVTASLVGIPVVAVGLILTSYIGIRHASIRALKSGFWNERVPIRISGVNPRSQESRIAAFISLFFLTILPLYALWHFLRKFHKYGEICDTRGSGTHGLWIVTDGWPFWDNRYLVGSNGDACNGFTYEPFFQPLLQLILASIATIAVVYFLYMVAFSSRNS